MALIIQATIIGCRDRVDLGNTDENLSECRVARNLTHLLQFHQQKIMCCTNQCASWVFCYKENGCLRDKQGTIRTCGCVIQALRHLRNQITSLVVTDAEIYGIQEPGEMLLGMFQVKSNFIAHSAKRYDCIPTLRHFSGHSSSTVATSSDVSLARGSSKRDTYLNKLLQCGTWQGKVG